MDEGYQLKRPCKNCPFAPTKTRITFACEERAREIAESAYRNGFPCHLSARYVEDESGENDGFVFGQRTQHCVGAIMMFLAGDESCWPGIDNDEELAERLHDHVDWKAAHYRSEEDFILANAEKKMPRARKKTSGTRQSRSK